MSFAISSSLIPIQLCGGKKTKYSKSLMYLEYFCLSPSHSMQFPVTAIIKSANFSGIIFLCVLFKSFIKKWKKVLRHSVWRGTVQGARKCIPAGFLRFFGNLKWSVTEKFLLIFYRKIYYRIPNLCKWPEMGLLNIPLKTASFQRLYFTFNFKIRNVTDMICTQNPGHINN